MLGLIVTALTRPCSIGVERPFQTNMLAIRDGQEVIRVDARLVRTGVMQINPLRDVAVFGCEVHPMCFLKFLIDPYHSVPLLFAVSLPHPASGFRVNAVSRAGFPSMMTWDVFDGMAEQPAAIRARVGRYRRIFSASAHALAGGVRWLLNRSFRRHSVSPLYKEYNT